MITYLRDAGKRVERYAGDTAQKNDFNKRCTNRVLPS